MGLFAPADRREALWALYAFNHEVAKTREVVTETRLGLIRLQWWKDAVLGIFNGQKPLKHQVVEPLAEAIAKYSLPREPFETLMSARDDPGSPTLSRASSPAPAVCDRSRVVCG